MSHGVRGHCDNCRVHVGGFHVDSRFLKEDAASLNLRHDFLKRALAGIGYITLLLLLKRGVCLWWCR